MAKINGNDSSLVAKTKETRAQKAEGKSLAMLVNELMDSNGIKKRINELLGRRAPQFVGSLVSMINADANLQLAFKQAPMTIIQAGLRAATYDLPIDPGLGYAYIIPFNNSVKGEDNKWYKRMEAQFIMGYKGMYQLAMRTGVYSKLNVVDIRDGELVSYDRLTEDIEINFIEDEDERDKKPIIGWCGFFRLVNGMEKKIYMTVKQIEQHERKHRKGNYMGKGWRDDFEAMCAKTVLRRLIGKWGIMSIDYQKADEKALTAATAIASGSFDDEDKDVIEASAVTGELEGGRIVNMETGEILSADNAAEPVAVPVEQKLL